MVGTSSVEVVVTQGVCCCNDNILASITTYPLVNCEMTFSPLGFKHRNHWLRNGVILTPKLPQRKLSVLQRLFVEIPCPYLYSGVRYVIAPCEMQSEYPCLGHLVAFYGATKGSERSSLSLSDSYNFIAPASHKFWSSRIYI